MLVHRGYRYRIYPTAEQEVRLLRWEGVLRFLWNLGLEQWKLWMSRQHGKRRYPSAFSQKRELTDLRAEHDWVADVPRHVCDEIFFNLEDAWKRCFRGGWVPRWKRRGEPVGLRESTWKNFAIGVDHVAFPKLGRIRAVIHRPLGGKQKALTITRDGDQWFASVLCEVEIPDPMPSQKPAVGLDRGVVNLLADSEGRLVENPKHLERMRARIARAQRVVARRKKGSKNREKAKARVARLHRTVRWQREHVLHVESTRYAKSHGVIVIEKLYVKAMTASAAGTTEEPGRNVRQKAGLNRSILAAGWGRFALMLRYKVVPEGGEVREVVAAYSSQTCSRCGCVDAVSRVSQAVFRCTACGHEEHADTNAAKVILGRGINLTAVEHTVAGCGGSANGRPTKQQARPARAQS